MEMNGIKGFTRLDACIKALNAGITMFIFRDSSKEIFDLITQLETAVNDGFVSESIINRAVQKVLDLKQRYLISR